MSYGEGPKYVCRHEGYVSEVWGLGESEPFDTHAEAVAELIRTLQEEIERLEGA